MGENTTVISHIGSERREIVYWEILTDNYHEIYLFQRGYLLL